VLAFVAQQAVQVYGWLAPGEMVRGLALAETTPGPLIMVVQFVAFLGAYRNPGELDPWAAAVLASLVTTWVTFVPCFLFILLGAPYVERLRHNKSLSAALAGITAAVVGVIANLAVYFTLHTLFGDVVTVTAGPLQLELPAGDVQWAAVAITVLACVLLFGRGWPVLRTIGACAAAGVGPVPARRALTGARPAEKGGDTQPRSPYAVEAVEGREADEVDLPSARAADRRGRGNPGRSHRLRWFDVLAVVDDGGAYADFEEDGNAGHLVHSIGGLLIPFLALVLLIVSFFAKIPGGVKWAAITFGVAALQVVLAILAFSLPAIGALHGINALVLAGCGRHGRPAGGDPHRKPAKPARMQLCDLRRR
jgi:chromate transport protein ChrA